MTAVSSLVERLLPLIDRSKISDVALHSIVEEHLAMEKKQIIDALMTSEVELLAWGISAEKYYNETFKSE